LNLLAILYNFSALLFLQRRVAENAENRREFYISLVIMIPVLTGMIDAGHV
jgi:hypothetical protein